VELRELKDYTVFSSTAMLPGMTVALHLKPAFVIDELYEHAQGQLLCSEIPIQFRIDSDAVLIPSSVPDVTDAELLGPTEPRNKEPGIETFSWKGVKDEVELAFNLAFRRTAGRPSFLDENGGPLLSGPEGGIHWPSLAICGFRGNFFNAFGLFCFDLPRVSELGPAGERHSQDFAMALRRRFLKKVYQNDKTGLIWR
jgi:hypothetical protein